jgi:hypothetical protein
VGWYYITGLKEILVINRSHSQRFYHVFEEQLKPSQFVQRLWSCDFLGSLFIADCAIRQPADLQRFLFAVLKTTKIRFIIRHFHTFNYQYHDFRNEISISE